MFFSKQEGGKSFIIAEGKRGGQEQKGRLRRIGVQIREYIKEKEEVITQGNGPIKNDKSKAEKLRQKAENNAQVLGMYFMTVVDILYNEYKEMSMDDDKASSATPVEG